MPKLDSTPKYSLIIPAFKAGSFIEECLKTKIEILKTLKESYEIIIVVDGYDKHTIKSVHKFKKNRNVKIIVIKRNHGKGFAVREGFKKAQGELIGYMDADNDINPKILKVGFQKLENLKFDAVLPSKNHPDSIINYPKSRKLFSRLYNYIVRKFFKLNISDSQLGAKFYTKKLVKEVLPKCKINGFAFEVEMIKIASKMGYNKFLEIPVEVNLKTKSTISFLNGVIVIFDTLLLLPRLIYVKKESKKNTKLGKKP